MHVGGLLLVLILGFSGVFGSLTISNVLGNNMVLQRGVPTRIWGWDTPSTKISVSILNENYSTTSGSDGSWQVTLASRGEGGPFIINIEDGTDTLQMTNVLFGDVWVCSGQKHMAFPLSWAFNSTAEINDTINYPNIRVFNVGSTNISSTPLSQLAEIATPWSIPSPSFMSSFSAVCWFHARNLYQFNSVPLGLIESAWGGTIIEAWSSPEALAACNSTNSIIDSIEVNPNQNSVLWNAMINPLLPTAIFGVLWYQGEQNTNEPTLYGCREKALINDWRKNFGTEFYFNFVQLAPWSGNENFNTGTNKNIPDTRTSQLEGLTLPRVSFATAVDLGDSLSPYNDIHPRYKQEVGKRLARSTLSVAFGEDIDWEPPQLLKAALVSTSPNIVFSIAVDNVESGLIFVDNTCPSNVPVSNCTNFAAVLSDGNTYTAVGNITGANSVEVSLANPNNLSPTILYYGYSSWPVLTIFRKDDGYPLLPFKITSS